MEKKSGREKRGSPSALPLIIISGDWNQHAGRVIGSDCPVSCRSHSPLKALQGFEIVHLDPRGQYWLPEYTSSPFFHRCTSNSVRIDSRLFEKRLALANTARLEWLKRIPEACLEEKWEALGGKRREEGKQEISE